MELNAEPHLLLEVKQFRNLSKPYQRVSKAATLDKEKIESAKGVKKDDSFQLICHDGVRFLKLTLMMDNQISLIKGLNERNKFLLKAAYIDVDSEKGIVNALVDGMD